MLAAGCICRIDGCSNAQHTKGFCAAHYMRVKSGATGDKLLAAIGSIPRGHPRPVTPCKLPACDRPRGSALGFCAMHARRWHKGLRGKDLVRRVKYHRRGSSGPREWCCLPGCKEPPWSAKSAGMRGILCQLHGDRWARGLRGHDLRKPIQAQAGRKRVNPGGYVEYNENGRTVLEHRAIIERILGRGLLPAETVHHINGDRADNRPVNLELWSSNHPKGQRVTDLLSWARSIIATYEGTLWDEAQRP